MGDKCGDLVSGQMWTLPYHIISTSKQPVHWPGLLALMSHHCLADIDSAVSACVDCNINHASSWTLSDPAV